LAKVVNWLRYVNTTTKHVMILPSIPVFHPRIKASIRMKNQRSPETFVVKVKMTYFGRFENDAVSTPQLNHQSKFMKHNLTTFTIRGHNNQTPILVSLIPVTKCCDIEIGNVSSEWVSWRLFFIWETVGICLQSNEIFRKGRFQLCK
jgi:hypothetical protein